MCAKLYVRLSSTMLKKRKRKREREREGKREKEWERVLSLNWVSMSTTAIDPWAIKFVDSGTLIEFSNLQNLPESWDSCVLECLDARSLNFSSIRILRLDLLNLWSLKSLENYVYHLLYRSSSRIFGFPRRSEILGNLDLEQFLSFLDLCIVAILESKDLRYWMLNFRYFLSSNSRSRSRDRSFIR